jgi:2-methylcitrate dehydratase PrpD
MELIKKIHVTPDPNLDQGRPELICKVDMNVTTKQDRIHHKTVEVPSGFPGNPLTGSELKQRFYDYVDYESRPLSKKNIEQLVVLIDRLEEVEDVRKLLPLLVTQVQV